MRDERRHQAPESPVAMETGQKEVEEVDEYLILTPKTKPPVVKSARVLTPKQKPPSPRQRSLFEIQQQGLSCYVSSLGSDIITLVYNIPVTFGRT